MQYCSSCGNQLKENVNFCESCGAPTKKQETMQNPNTAQNTKANFEVSHQQYTGQEQNSSDKYNFAALENWKIFLMVVGANFVFSYINEFLGAVLFIPVAIVGFKWFSDRKKVNNFKFWDYIVFGLVCFNAFGAIVFLIA